MCLKILIVAFCLKGNNHLLTLVITTSTQPDNEIVHTSAEANLLSLLQSEEVLQSLAQTLSEEFEAYIKLNGVRKGSIKVNMVLEDLSKLEYIKEMSDKWVLSTIVDSVLMTPEFIESCQAEDVVLDVVIDEQSYQQLKSLFSEFNKPIIKDSLLRTVLPLVCKISLMHKGHSLFVASFGSYMISKHVFFLVCLMYDHFRLWNVWPAPFMYLIV